MDTRDVAVRAPPKGSAGMDHSEEMVAEVDEPPDEWQHTYRTSHFWSPPKFHPPQYNRRESLLTRQLHSETEHTDDEHHQPSRALSTQSTFSNPSTTSTAELTSDDGHSVASPAISPPLGPTHVTTLPIHEKPLDRRVRIVGHDGTPATGVREVGSEQTLEANLGRKRCISFACRGKPLDKPETKQEPVTSPEPQTKELSPPPKRKSMIKFACPTRSASTDKAVEKPTKRPASPAPLRRPSADAKAQAFRSHRGSDSTVTHPSPKSSRKPSVSRSSSTRDDSQRRRPSTMRKLSNDSDSEGQEATRFHEFATSEEEPEDWTRESTCHRSRLTLDDVLKKENVIRQACEEAEEEVVEEEEEEEEEDEAEEEEDEQADEMAEVDKDENDGLDEEEDDSDEGFHSDDEEGFASSDDDDNDSDYEWWKPGASTAATSVEHLDRLAIVNAKPVEQSSVGSASSGRESIRSLRHRLHKRHNKTPAININNRPPTPDLPDSTDFVCGTLDEDRPLEQAYINRKKMKEAAKHGSRPQDIDPSFPTSDPEMDEEDDDDVDEVARSEDEEEEEEEEHDLMHGGLDEIHGTAPLGRTISNRNRGRSNSHRSPPPAKHLSPPPPKRRSVARSPPPPTKRGNARSPPPRKLFGHSPKRMRSPAPPLGKRIMTSPPNSPTQGTSPLSTAPHLAERPRLQHTASLPRGGGFILSRLATIHQDRRESSAGHDNNGNDSDGAATAVEIPKRGAIDIVKGLERKRRLRKEKMYQKLCAKQAAKGEKVYKVKPGKGCERMREVGLGVQEYRGQRAEHILSL